LWVAPVALALLPVWALQSPRSQEWLCYSSIDRISYPAFALALQARYNVASLRTRPIRPVNEKGFMASRTVWHFAYGSYMNRAQMLARGGNILEERNASLPNYEVRFNKKVRGGTAGANIQMASGKTVHGVLYKVDESALRSLDRYEGVPDHYRRIEVQVTPEGGQPVPAQIYIASKVEKGLRPSAPYLQAMLDGAGEHNLPAAYIGEIKSAAGAA
jgi:gamma-glutamylcyclotransferase